MDRRSRNSGRSWCAMVATEAWRRATCDSSAIVTLSRKRRCTRVLTVPRNHVAVAETPRPIADATISVAFPSSTPLPSSISHRASNASGSTASCDNTNAASISRGSWRYPSLQRRHIDDSAGGSGSIGASRTASAEDVIGHALLALDGEALRLAGEHRAVAACLLHHLGLRPERDDAARFDHADLVGVTHGGEPVGYQDGGALPRRRQ